MTARERHKIAMRDWRSANPIRAAYTNLKQNASRRKKSFAITFEEFAAWCKETNYITRKGREGDKMHIDRINHLKGYSIDNIQILSCRENSQKGNREKKLKVAAQGAFETILT